MMSGLAPVVVALSVLLASGQESSQSNEHLQHFGWLMGQWESVPSDAPGGPPFVVPALECKWILNNQFIVITMDIASPDGQVVAAMSSTILWDPSDQKIKYWGLGSDGRHGQAVLVRSDEKQAVWNDRLVMPDGEVRTGTFTFARSDRNTWTLQSNGYRRADRTTEPPFQISFRRKSS
jgi:hypothetical protein